MEYSLKKWLGPWNGLKLLHAVSWKSVKYTLGSLNVLEIAYPGLWNETHKFPPYFTLPLITILVHIIQFFYVGPGISFNYLLLCPGTSYKLDTRKYSLVGPQGPWNFSYKLVLMGPEFSPVSARGPWVSSNYIQLSDPEFPPIIAHDWGFYQLSLVSPEFPVNTACGSWVSSS